MRGEGLKQMRYFSIKINETIFMDFNLVNMHIRFIENEKEKKKGRDLS